jgi:predicted SAM-dependent methyltransferase
LRIATPDLDYLIERYNTSWRDQEWLKDNKRIQTRAEMINTAFRDWEHRYLYNEEELIRRLEEAGFTKIYRRELNESDYKELCNRETRADSKLILEAIK